MCNVQTCSSVLCQLYSQRRGSETCVHTANARMIADRKIVLSFIFLFEGSDVCLYNASVFTVRHQQKRRGGKDAPKGFGTVHKHIACATSHKDFHASHTTGVQHLQCLHILVGSTKVERVVYTAMISCNLEFLLQSLNRGSRWLSVGHFHVRCHATSSGCAAFTGNICFVCHARLSEMHMVVNHTREEIQPCGVYFQIVSL